MARVPVPAAAIDEILDLGLRTDEMPVLRACAAVVLAFAFFHRGDTGHKLLARHISVHAHGISISPRAKTLPLNVAYPLTRFESARFDPESRVWRLLKKWQDYAKTYQKPGSSFWALPRKTAKRFPAKRCLLAVAWKPQPSKKYSGHSLLKGGASGVFHGTFALYMYNVLTTLTTFSVDSANMPPLNRPCRGNLPPLFGDSSPFGRFVTYRTHHHR